MPININFNLFY